VHANARTLTLRLLFVFLLTAVPARAQFETATVLGTVRDSSSATVPEATVTLTNVDTGIAIKRTTTPAGDYEFPAVRVGRYVVTAEKSGFSVALVDNVQAEVGARLRVDLQMTVGSLSERVEVTAATPLMETDSSQRSQIITGDQMRALPLNGREYSALALLTTGVRQSALNKSTNGTPREGAFNVNGLRSTFNNFLIDGVDNNAYGTSNQGFSNQVMQPAPDAIGQFQVVTNNQSAEYGRAAGATINVVYRSGTNQLHGNGWEFFRDTSLSAMPYFKPIDGNKPPLRRNQFGGVVGGPIVRNRAFFFADYEGFRQDRKQPAFSTIPLAAQQQGIFPVDIRDPRNGVIYPAGTPMPMTTLARAVMTGLPDPNVSGAANNYSIVQQLTNDSNKAGGKVDLQITPSLSAFGRFGWRKLDTVDQPPIPLPAGGGGNGNIYVKNRQLVLGTTYIANNNSLLEMRFGWSNTKGGKNPPALGTSSTEFGLTGLPSDARIAGGLPSQTIVGFAALGRQATNPQWQYPTVWNPKVNFTTLRGRQSLKAGYEYQHIGIEVQDINPLYGLDTYGGQFTRPAGAAANTLYNLADFMLGLRSQYALSTFFVAQIKQDLHFTYLQDDIRLNDRLTLNAGVRYEYATPFYEADNILTNFDPTTNTMVKAADGSIADRALVDPDRNNVAPRLGLAYTLTPSTVLRGSWGVSYVHVNRIGSANELPLNAPQVIRAVVNQTDPTAAAFRPTEQGYPLGITDPSTFNPVTALVSFIPRDFHSSPVQSWYASVQQQFGSNMRLDVAYVGNKADDLLLIGNYNQAVPNNAAGTIPLAARRPNPTFGDITYVFNGGKSRYNALQTKLEWRGRDVTLLQSLTLSEAKDNAAGSLENQNGNFPAPQDLHNLDADYGLSGYHQAYNSTTSFVYELPFGRGRHFGTNMPVALDALAGGWQLSGINTVTPGEMVTLVYTPLSQFAVSGITNDFSGANNYRPNITCDPYAADRTITGWFNPACVAIPAGDQPFGNAPRNNVRGPNYWTFDFAAVKQVSLGGTSRLELRVETFNLFNRANFTAPNGNRSSAAFGTIASTYDPRQVQLGVKVLW
jgi:hypothetical protein